jgi:hypothetical protein
VDTEAFGKCYLIGVRVGVLELSKLKRMAKGVKMSKWDKGRRIVLVTSTRKQK